MKVIKNIFVLLSVCSFCFFASVAVMYGKTSAADSCSQSHVQIAINAASSGDTVTVPAGSCTWTSPIIITTGITLQGAGIGNTVITGDITDPTNGVISFKPDAAARSVNILTRISGFTLDAASKSNGIHIENDSATPVTKIRIDHNRIINAGGVSAGRAINIIGSVYGVADNNTLVTFGHGMDSTGTNDTQWANLPRAYGDADNFYFEDNSLTVTSSGGNVFHAGGHGGRYVARYNDYLNKDHTSGIFPVFDMHGNQPSDITAMMINEVYGNDIDLGLYNARLFDQRGSMVMAFWNKITYGGDSPHMLIREEYLDSNYPLGNSYVMHVTNSYYFNNRKNDTLITNPVVYNNQYDDTYDLAKNTDFWIHNTSYNGTTEIGVYCGTSLPSNCTTGDGAWITAQSCSAISEDNVGVNPTTPLSGTFYKCTGTNTWTAYYTPYTYPHPLRSLGEETWSAPPDFSTTNN